MARSPEVYDETFPWDDFHYAVDSAREQSGTLWCKASKPGNYPPRPAGAVPDVEFFELTGIEAADGTLYPPTFSGTYDQPGTYHWRRWLAAHPDQTQTLSADILPKHLGDCRRPPAPPSYDYKKVTIPRLVLYFGRLASTASEFAGVTDILVDWMADATQLDPDSQSTLLFAIPNIVFTAAMRADNETVSQLAEAFQKMHNSPLGTWVSAQINSSLGKLLIGKKCGNFLPQTVQKADQQATVGLIQAFDKAGLIGDEFWIKYGVEHAGGAINTHFLPLLYQHLQDRAPCVKGEAAQQLTKWYMHAVLSEYRDAPDRHQTNAAILAEKVSDTDLRKIAGLANGLLRQLTQMPQAEGLPAYLPAAHATLEPTDISDAFLRFLYCTLDPELPFAARAQQFEQDCMHAGIVARIYEGVRQRRAQTLGWAAFYLPDLSPKEVQSLQRLTDPAWPY